MARENHLGNCVDLRETRRFCLPMILIQKVWGAGASLFFTPRVIVMGSSG